jgi:hypothetical protein
MITALLENLDFIQQRSIIEIPLTHSVERRITLFSYLDSNFNDARVVGPCRLRASTVCTEGPIPEDADQTRYAGLGYQHPAGFDEYWYAEAELG